MIVHFVAPLIDLPDNIDNFRKIVGVIKENGHTLSMDWIESAYQRKLKGFIPNEAEWQTIVEENFAAISRADAIIAETTTNSLVIGYQIAVAIQQKKPVLVIQQHKAEASQFLWSMPQELFVRAKYDQDTLRSVIEKFLEDNDIKSKDLRFNFFIDRKIYNYLRWAAFKTGKTKAEILRDLVEREISNGGKS